MLGAKGLGSGSPLLSMWSPMSPCPRIVHTEASAHQGKAAGKLFRVLGGAGGTQGLARDGRLQGKCREPKTPQTRWCGVGRCDPGDMAAPSSTAQGESC